MDIKHPNSGGSEIYSWEICKRLIKDGHSVTYITSRFGTGINEEQFEGVRIIRIGNWITLYPRAFFWIPKHVAEFDLIIEVINGLPFMLPFKLKGAKHVVIIFHLPTLRATSLKLPLIGPLEFVLSRVALRYLYRKRKIITDGIATKKELESLGFSEICVAEDGLNIEERYIDPLPTKQKRAVILGPLKPWKRIEQGLIAFSTLPDPWELDIIGNGEANYLKKLHRIASDLGIANRVTFHGYVDELRKRSIIGSSVLTIITSEKEGFSLTALECQRYGCIPVVYDFPGIETSVIHNVTSIVVRNGDLNKIKEMLAAFVKDEQRINRISISAIEFSKRFTWDYTYDKIMRFITEVPPI